MKVLAFSIKQRIAVDCAIDVYPLHSVKRFNQINIRSK